MKNKTTALTGFLLHLHPKKVNEQAIKYTRTFGLGGINALLFFILVFTGLLLRFWYVPTPDDAYNSIVALQNNSFFGSLIRNLHHWSAMLMIVTAFLHLLRVFYSTSIYYERKKNWYYGLFLFIIVLAFNFTGYLLPWDQLSYWAVTIMTNIVEYIPFVGESFANLIRGGEIVNGNTLLNFYTFHTALLPLLFVVFMALHFWLIRKAKGVTVADNSQKEMLEVNPNLINIEILVALIIIATLLLFAMFFNAPLLDKANPMISPNPSKAPWYFMGIQELLINLHPIITSFIIPISLFVFLYFIAKLEINENNIGTWFYSVKGKRITIISAIFAVLLSISLIIIFEYILHLNTLNMPLYISQGIIPFMMYFIPASLFVYYLKRALNSDRIELVISIITLLVFSYITMSIVGVFLRGEGMKLIF